MSFKLDLSAIEPLALPMATGVPWRDPIAVYVGVEKPIERRRTYVSPLNHDPSVYESEKEIPQDLCPNVRFTLCREQPHSFSKRRSLIAKSHHPTLVKAWTPDGRLIGEFGGFAPYVDPEFQGRGIGAVGQYLHDLHLRRLAASSYTPSGLRARAAVHGLHVNAAIARGETVSDVVMADYRMEQGRAVLRTPYTPEHHESLRDRYRATQQGPRYAAITKNMISDTSANVTDIIGGPRSYEPDWHAFALRAHEALSGSKILKVKMSYATHLAVLTAEKDRVIDIFGERAPEHFAAEAALRFRIEMPKITTMRPQGVDKISQLLERFPPSQIVDAALQECGLIAAPMLSMPELEADQVEMRI